MLISCLWTTLPRVSFARVAHLSNVCHLLLHVLQHAGRAGRCCAAAVALILVLILRNFNQKYGLQRASQLHCSSCTSSPTC